MKEEQVKWEELKMISRGLIDDLKLERLKNSKEQLDLFEAALKEYTEIRNKSLLDNGDSIRIGGFKNDWRS